jgi:hypothetical protein
VSRLVAYGVSLEPPVGWEARAFSHGEPTVHVASFPLPRTDGEFGSRSTARMPADGLFLSLTEYLVQPHELRDGIFAAQPPRRLRTEELSERTLLRPLPGQRGVQRFFSTEGRAFCLYLVCGRDGGGRLATVNRMLASLQVEARPAASTART